MLDLPQLCQTTEQARFASVFDKLAARVVHERGVNVVRWVAGGDAVDIRHAHEPWTRGFSCLFPISEERVEKVEN